MSVSISSNVHWGKVEDCDLHVCKITLDPGVTIDVKMDADAEASIGGGEKSENRG